MQCCEGVISMYVYESIWNWVILICYIHYTHTCITNYEASYYNHFPQHHVSGTSKRKYTYVLICRCMYSVVNAKYVCSVSISM